MFLIMRGSNKIIYRCLNLRSIVSKYYKVNNFPVRYLYVSCKSTNFIQQLQPLRYVGNSVNYINLIRNAATDSSEPASGSEFNPKKTSYKERLKQGVKQYGSIIIVFHVGISLLSLGGFYLALSSGVDVQSLLTKIGFSDGLINNKVAVGSSTFVIAYAVHKLFAPVRMGITLTFVPFLVRYLRRIGIFKAPKS